jgi:hypothetical protein
MEQSKKPELQLARPLLQGSSQVINYTLNISDEEFENRAINPNSPWFWAPSKKDKNLVQVNMVLNNRPLFVHRWISFCYDSTWSERLFSNIEDANSSTLNLKRVFEFNKADLLCSEMKWEGMHTGIHREFSAFFNQTVGSAFFATEALLDATYLNEF